MSSVHKRTVNWILTYGDEKNSILHIAEILDKVEEKLEKIDERLKILEPDIKVSPFIIPDIKVEGRCRVHLEEGEYLITTEGGRLVTLQRFRDTR